jgi:hypothetical protein
VRTEEVSGRRGVGQDVCGEGSGMNKHCLCGVCSPARSLPAESRYLFFHNGNKFGSQDCGCVKKRRPEGTHVNQSIPLDASGPVDRAAPIGLLRRRINSGVSSRRNDSDRPGLCSIGESY